MTHVFRVQDLAGNRSRVLHQADASAPVPVEQEMTRYKFRLEDGTPVRRVDNETFQVVSTGAYLSVVSG